MKATYCCQFHPRVCDLSSEADVRALFAWITAQPGLGGVDVCINNAGLSTSESLRAGTVQGWRSMLDVNVLGTENGVQISSDND